MTLTQSEVDDHFIMLVPVFADFGKGWMRIGQIGINGSTTRSVDAMLPSMPKRSGSTSSKRFWNVETFPHQSADMGAGRGIAGIVFVGLAA